MTATEYPVIGKLSEWDGMFPTRFKRFSRVDIHGLAWVNEKEHEIEIMAVGSDMPGAGHFRKFLNDLKANYRRVQFWACSAPMQETLKRHGFIGAVDMDEYGEMTQCCVWEVME